MKKIIFVICLLSNLSFSTAQTKSEIFNADSITWYGLDFSLIKLLGSSSFKDPRDIKENYFKSINDVIVNEKKKYNLEKFLHKKSIIYDLEVVKRNNDSVNYNNLTTDDPKYSEFISKRMLQELISKYDCGSDKGIGVVFVMENFNRMKDNTAYDDFSITDENNTASMIVVFFDIRTKMILLSGRMTAEAGGFGFRNYWVSTVYKVLKQIGDQKYNDWGK
jgi:hypothetical protein